MKQICKQITDVKIRKAEDVELSRTIEFIASDNSRDAHGTIVNQKGWDLDRFNKNGVIGYQHNVYGDNLCLSPNPDDVIGKGVARIEGEQLIIAVTFEPKEINETAEKIFRKILFGSLKAVSVGFIETGQGHYGEGEEGVGKSMETYYFEGQELLEVSIVNIPANKNAVKRSIRDNAVMALSYIYKALNGEFSMSDIEKMKIGDVLDMLENRKARVKNEDDEEEEKPKDDEEEKKSKVKEVDDEEEEKPKEDEEEDEEKSIDEEDEEEEDEEEEKSIDEEEEDEEDEEEEEEDEEKKLYEKQILTIANAKLALTKSNSYEKN